jgi:hypothetical protein
MVRVNDPPWVCLMARYRLDETSPYDSRCGAEMTELGTRMVFEA